MKPISPSLAAALLLVLSACRADGEAPPAAVAASPDNAAHELVARGDYLVRTTGCNDCHTVGYAERQGEVD